MYEGEQIKERTGTVSNNDGKAWCMNCRKRQPYNITMQVISTKDKNGIAYKFLNLEPYCRICKRELLVNEISDANADARYKAYMNAKRQGRG